MWRALVLTFPIKVMLCGASGNDLSSSSVVLHATAVTMASSYSGTPETVGNANPDNDFQFDITQGPTGGYIFNLSTQGWPRAPIICSSRRPETLPAIP